MSEVKLNLIDSKTILVGTIHGSIGDRCIAALSAEPETINELEAALERFDKEPPCFQSLFSERCEIDEEPYDAGILVIDLASRIVGCESTYSHPGPKGHVRYHTGDFATDFSIGYRLPDDWLFLSCIQQYKGARSFRRRERLSIPPIDTRAILYDSPLLEFIATNVQLISACRDVIVDEEPSAQGRPGLSPIGAIHAQWLLTPRADLQGRAPRDVMLAKQDFIDSDLQSRAFQWDFQLEGPPGLSRDSFAYRFAGFGTHEWIVYYELVRFLLESSAALSTADTTDFTSLVSQLETLKNGWLNEPSPEFDGHVPAIIIDNERRRMPEAMGGRSMVVDEDCPVCKMMGDDAEAGRGVWFWHLDGCNMDDHFAFSRFLTEKEYLEDRVQMELMHAEFDRKWKEREERIARGEPIDHDPFFDPSALDDFNPFALADPEPPEA